MDEAPTSLDLSPVLAPETAEVVCGPSGSISGFLSSGSCTFLGYSCCCNLGDIRAGSLANQEKLADVTCQAGAEED